MFLLDRSILSRFLTNFVILFTLLFFFAAAIDLILQLDEFVDVARRRSSGGAVDVAAEFLALAADFHLPRVFQFYAFLHGLVAVGAMAFTLAQMHRHRELVAMMASGVSLYRVAMPFFFAVFVLSIVGLINQELMMPRVAPLLLRGHDQIGQGSVREFPVPLTPDSQGNLLQSPSFNPATDTLQWPTIIERDERGLTKRRITAEEATWNARANAWQLRGGRAVRLDDDVRLGSNDSRGEPLDAYPTDLDPSLLTMRRHGEFASMLNLRQIDQMLEAGGGADARLLMRYRYARFATVLINLLVLALTLPCFLLREPANLLKQSILCAALAVPAMLGAAVGMMADLPGIAPIASVFLPVVILIFAALVPWTYFKT